MSNKFLVFLSVLFLLFLGIALVKANSQTKTTENDLRRYLTVNNQTIQIEIAQSAQDVANGLGNRDFLPENYGMLFLFRERSYPVFWMKNMRFPLDFIWIDGEIIVDVTENVSHKDQKKIYSPKFLIDKVLEVNAGFVNNNNIKIGDKIQFDKPVQ